MPARRVEAAPWRNNARLPRPCRREYSDVISALQRAWRLARPPGEAPPL